ncbi:RHS repeat-associated core domain-containing protein [Vibrio pomeroyi]|uniref:RHS repeat-associated core domain-containing protein n=1 Tax=Vibrio pomeroyi TaxID=198832 RepID=A0ABV4N546_9VIBR
MDKLDTKNITTIGDKPSGISRRTFLSSSIFVGILTSIPSIPKKVFAGQEGQSFTNELILFTQESSGFNGAVLDPISKQYQLGNGYRSYNAVLMRFHSMDSLSPFDEGGINSYAYGLNDPINFTDPSGHQPVYEKSSFWFSILAIVVGIAGAILAPFTGGTSVVVAAGIIGGVTGAIGGVLGVASASIEDTQPEIAARLNYAAIAFAAVSIGAGVVGGVSGATSGVKFASRASNFKTTFKFKLGISAKAARVSKISKAQNALAKKVNVASPGDKTAQAARFGNGIASYVDDLTVASTSTRLGKAAQVALKEVYKPAFFGSWKVTQAAKTSFSLGKATTSFIKTATLPSVSGVVSIGTKIDTAVKEKAKRDNTEQPQSSGTMIPNTQVNTASVTYINNNIRNGIFNINDDIVSIHA